MKEYVGEKAVQDLFDIIVGHYVYKEETEKRDSDLARTTS